jgi:mannan endo-1,4-beta-mannosidase
MLGSVALLATAWGAGAPQAIHLEAEDAERVGVSRVIPSEPATRATTRPIRRGYAGTGYVTDFFDDGDRVTFRVPEVSAGLYELHIRYAATSKKGFEVDVNGRKYSGMFPRSEGETFATHAAGRIELADGINRIAIEKGWGHYDIDGIDLVATSCPSPPAKPPKSIADANSTPEARALFERLIDQYSARRALGRL